jgi:hypothetical protein
MSDETLNVGTCVFTFYLSTISLHFIREISKSSFGNPAFGGSERVAAFTLRVYQTFIELDESCAQMIRPTENSRFLIIETVTQAKIETISINRI